MSRNRTYIPKAVYHVGLNPKFREAYFAEDVFCYILARVLLDGQGRKDYKLIGYKINPDHVHLLIQCGKRFNISEIVHHIKRVSSMQINMVRTKGTESAREGYHWTAELWMNHAQLCMKFGSIDNVPYPLFYWQQSFNDVIIRSPEHLQRAISYLQRQTEMHNLGESYHYFLAKELPNDIAYMER